MKNRPSDRPLPLLAHLVPRFTDPEPADHPGPRLPARCPPTAGSAPGPPPRPASPASNRSGPAQFGPEGRFEEAPVKGNYLYLPIRLTTGVDRGRVIDDAVGQLRHIAERLRALRPSRTNRPPVRIVREPEGPA